MSQDLNIPQGTFLGHPKGLYLLFATEMWERFSFYGMRALLVLYAAAATHDVSVSNQAAGTIDPQWAQVAIEELRGCGQAGGKIGSFPLAMVKVSL